MSGNEAKGVIFLWKLGMARGRENVGLCASRASSLCLRVKQKASMQRQEETSARPDSGHYPKLACPPSCGHGD